MRQWKNHKCPECGKVYKSTGAFRTHMETEHPGAIPEGWSIMRYIYFVHTGRTAGSCRICHGPTLWNESTGAYARICTNPACKKKYRDDFLASMRNRGKEKFMEDPDHIRKMMMGRRISGTMKFYDGGEVAYMGKLEKAFLYMLNTFFRFPSSDIIAPSPNTYTYWYDNPKDPDKKGYHMYTPDFYIPSANLEIEIKSAINNRPGHLEIDVVRDAHKDTHMFTKETVNYVKLYEDDYHVFFQVFADVADRNISGIQGDPIRYVSRALLTSIYMNHIPKHCLDEILKYIYKYSEKSVLRSPATETEMPILETPEEEPTDLEDEPGSITDIYAADLEEENEIYEDAELTIEVGIDPMSYYGLESMMKMERLATHSDMHLHMFDESYFDLSQAAIESEGEFINGLVTSKVDTSSWKKVLFPNGMKLVYKTTKFVNVSVKNGIIKLSGMNATLFLNRVKNFYDAPILRSMMVCTYTPGSLKKFQAQKISRGQMTISALTTPEFFALELVIMLNELGQRFKDLSYLRAAQTLYAKSWLAEADKKKDESEDLSLAPLSNIALELMPHQTEFIKQWPKLKSKLNTRGYVLAFKPGKGKTLTSLGLAECIKAPKVYIVCPNPLKDAWALEIRKYFKKYEDDKLWHKDVCILGNKTFNDPTNAKYIITNNENLQPMLEVATKNSKAMFILDESHNFRNVTGKRSNELFELVDKIDCDNNLCVSATPIKGVPSELAPVLRIIDRLFTNDAMVLYSKAFNMDSDVAMHMVQTRFGSVIYRPEVAVTLPPKTEEPMNLKLANESRFYMAVVRAEAREIFRDMHEKWLKSVAPETALFEEKIKEYSMASKSETLLYLRWVINSTKMGNMLADEGLHELQLEGFKSFLDNYIRVNPNVPPLIMTQLANMEREFLTASRRHMGIALGKVLPPRRVEMFTTLFDVYQKTFMEMIGESTKKTLIFSTMVPVVTHIGKKLNDAGIKSIVITGSTPNRIDAIAKFKEDPEVMCLVATSQTLGTGLTLIEANQMFFFGTPWRSSDFEQASDRIWRIGQTDPVVIRTVGLDASQVNLSSRMNDILEWSAKMFDSTINMSAEMMGEEAATESLMWSNLEPHDYAVMESFVVDESPRGCAESFMRMIQRQTYDFTYGWFDPTVGRIVQLDDRFDYGYRTLAPLDVKKYKGGICWDFAAYIHFVLKNCEFDIRPTNYFVITNINGCTTHTFTEATCGGTEKYVVESGYNRTSGVRHCDAPKYINVLLNEMRAEHKHVGKIDYAVYAIIRPDKLYGLSCKEYMDTIIEDNSIARKIRHVYSEHVAVPEMAGLEQAGVIHQDNPEARNVGILTAIKRQFSLGQHELDIQGKCTPYAELISTEGRAHESYVNQYLLMCNAIRERTNLSVMTYLVVGYWKTPQEDNPIVNMSLVGMVPWTTSGMGISIDINSNYEWCLIGDVNDIANMLMYEELYKHDAEDAYDVAKLYITEVSESNLQRLGQTGHTLYDMVEGLNVDMQNISQYVPTLPNFISSSKDTGMIHVSDIDMYRKNGEV